MKTKLTILSASLIASHVFGAGLVNGTLSGVGGGGSGGPTNGLTLSQTINVSKNMMLTNPTPVIAANTATTATTANTATTATSANQLTGIPGLSPNWNNNNLPNPPTLWDSWYSFGNAPTESGMYYGIHQWANAISTEVHENINAYSKTHIIVIDGGYFSNSVSSTGLLQINPTNFPSGAAALINVAHTNNFPIILTMEINTNVLRYATNAMQNGQLALCPYTNWLANATNLAKLGFDGVGLEYSGNVEPAGTIFSNVMLFYNAFRSVSTNQTVWIKMHNLNPLEWSMTNYLAQLPYGFILQGWGGQDGPPIDEIITNMNYFHVLGSQSPGRWISDDGVGQGSSSGNGLPNQATAMSLAAMYSEPISFNSAAQGYAESNSVYYAINNDPLRSFPTLVTNVPGKYAVLFKPMADGSGVFGIFAYQTNSSYSFTFPDVSQFIPASGNNNYWVQDVNWMTAPVLASQYILSTSNQLNLTSTFTPSNTGYPPMLNEVVWVRQVNSQPVPLSSIAAPTSVTWSNVGSMLIEYYNGVAVMTNDAASRTITATFNGPGAGGGGSGGIPWPYVQGSLSEPVDQPDWYNKMSIYSYSVEQTNGAVILNLSGDAPSPAFSEYAFTSPKGAQRITFSVTCASMSGTPNMALWLWDGYASGTTLTNQTFAVSTTPTTYSISWPDSNTVYGAGIWLNGNAGGGNCAQTALIVFSNSITTDVAPPPFRNMVTASVLRNANEFTRVTANSPQASSDYYGYRSSSLSWFEACTYSTNLSVEIIDRAQLSNPFISVVVLANDVLVTNIPSTGTDVPNSMRLVPLQLAPGLKKLKFINSGNARIAYNLDYGSMTIRSVFSDQPFYQVPAVPQNRINFWGDSITMGQEASVVGMSSLVPNIRKQGWDATDLGIGYDTLQMWTNRLDRLTRMLTQNNPQVIWLNMGRNDYSIPSMTAPVFQQWYSNMLNAIVKRTPALIVAQSPIVQQTETSNGLGYTLSQYRLAISNAVFTVNNPEITYLEGSNIVSVSTLFDQVHPTDVGFAQWSKVVMQYLSTLQP